MKTLAGSQFELGVLVIPVIHVIRVDVADRGRFVGGSAAASAFKDLFHWH
ncbi:hypothetical protein [Paenibacillus eucommiae]|uniref:Uncharacterized protein n=1 Tax=Paenibacillus eucommiae TaxID=1355755 RepID=A0ABS4IXK0_9BACL|nr:hypothetical protein [Paenibacillus eucommiae]MBP1992307.1 hypothetical protein [Paenibacillus eucommiae]